MKKQFYSILIAAASTAAALLTLASCHDDIYGLINNEVALESHGLNGDCTIVRYKDCLALANGSVYLKTGKPSRETGGENRQWNRTTSPTTEKGDNDVPATTCFLAADADYLYALSYIWEEDEDGDNYPKRAELYVTNSDPADGNGKLEWKKIELVDTGITDSLSFRNVQIIFGNQAAEQSERAAYARIRKNGSSDYKLYRLNGTDIPTEVADAHFIDPQSNAANAVSACRFEGTDYFSQYYSMSANSSYIYYTKSRTKSNSRVDGDSSLYYRDPRKSDYREAKVDAGSILSLAVTNNFVLIGTTGGIKRVRLYDGIPENDTTKFSNNGNSIINEYVFAVFVLEPDKNEGETDEYAVSTIHGSIRSSSDAWEDAGLYAYYPTRREWNRDGD